MRSAFIMRGTTRFAEGVSCLVRPAAAASLALAAVGLIASATHAAPITLDWVTVGDPGNAADINPTENGAVANSFQIMKYELTNSQYVAFLNAKAATDPYGLYDTRMGSDARGGITQNGSSGSYTYAVKADMADKPVNYVSWFDAARVANWFQNGQGSGSTETGAYTLVGGQTSGLAPARNAGATIFLPTENEWYKAAYYKGGGTNAGYWVYATQSDSAPTAVTSSTTGVGSAGNTGNFANYNLAASWNGETGIMTSVGTNGGPSAYGAFDMVGNVWEWNDLTGAPNTDRGLRGGSWATDSAENVSSGVGVSAPTSLADSHFGFRLAMAVVPEPSTWVMGVGGLACGGLLMRRRHRRVGAFQTPVTSP